MEQCASDPSQRSIDHTNQARSDLRLECATKGGSKLPAPEHIIWFLVIGGMSGWLAGILTKGRGFGILGNVVVGLVGAVIGGHIFQFVGVPGGGGFISTLVTSLVGALVLIFLINLIRKGP
jgi:uncharacterized membrane protein YeaQ/YmgE (transglycosylase-associated protein family)